MLETCIITQNFIDGKEFYADSIEENLEKCEKEGYEALLMPTIVDTRIGSPADSVVWQRGYMSTSLKATGKTKQGNAIVIYAHIPNYFSKPENVREAKQKGLIKGSGIMPEEEFKRLLDLEDEKNVFVRDYDVIKNSSSGFITIQEALKHPLTIPLFQGRKRAEVYLKRHEEVYGQKINIWHSDTLIDQPLGRLLFIGGKDYRLIGDDSLHDKGYFFAMPIRMTAQEIVIPRLEQILNPTTDSNPIPLKTQESISH